MEKNDDKENDEEGIKKWMLWCKEDEKRKVTGKKEERNGELMQE